MFGKSILLLLYIAFFYTYFRPLSVLTQIFYVYLYFLHIFYIKLIRVIIMLLLFVFASCFIFFLEIFFFTNRKQTSSPFSQNQQSQKEVWPSLQGGKNNGETRLNGLNKSNKNGSLKCRHGSGDENHKRYEFWIICLW